MSDQGNDDYQPQHDLLFRQQQLLRQGQQILMQGQALLHKQGDAGHHQDQQKHGQDDHKQGQDQQKQGDDQKGDDKNKDKKDGDKKDEAEDPDIAKKRKRKAIFILVPLFIVLAIIALLFWLHARHYEHTDDAFIDGHTSQVSPQVGGQVITLLIRDNQEVKAGQLLFQLDPRDEIAKLQQAKASKANAEAQKLQAIANVRTSEANLNKAQRDLDRYKSTDVRAVSKQQIDQVEATVESDEASLEASKAQVAAGDASIGQADADIAAAQLQLAYTDIRAPQAGRVTRRTVELGNYLNAGQAALAIVSDNLWVTANFKENQLDYMKPGQHVDIAVDAYPDATITGHVDSVQSGTGSVFSSLPAENATGNYVKIVQRVPVKILIDKIEHDDNQQVRLAPGLSVVPRVTVR